MAAAPLVTIERVESTQVEARRLARAGAPHGTGVLARLQTGGRGRLQRTWLSGPGNLHLTCILRPDLPLASWPLLSLGAAVELVDLLPGPCRLKWPNDLLLPDGRKVAGLLGETEGSAVLLLGVGVNLAEAPPLATAASLSGLDPPSPLALARALLPRLCALPELVRSDPGRLLARWRARSATLGRWVEVAGHRGVAEDLGPDGALWIREGADLVPIRAGEVALLGSAPPDGGSLG